MKATLPVGVLPYCPATTAENVTAWFTDEELADVCKAMAQMSNGTMSVTSETVELDQSPTNVLAEIEAATRELEEPNN